MSHEHRILLRGSTRLDAAVARELLFRAGIEAWICADLQEVVSEMANGAGALMLTEQSLEEQGIEALCSALADQPEWSDLPLLVLAREQATPRAIAAILHRFANVTVIERPAQAVALVSAARSALRARRRQYQLRTTLAGLAEAERRKDEFLAMLAHELRNSLAPISTTLSLMEPSVADRDGHPSGEAPRHLDVIRRQVNHLTGLVDDLMDVSGIARGTFDLAREPLDLADALHDAIAAARPQLEARGHRLSLDVKSGLGIAGDRLRLAQVFAHLLDNATKYTAPGGHLRVAAHREGPDAVVEVGDDGIGLPAGRLESIFQLFVQFNVASRGALTGLGIGLALARALVERHGGSIRAVSAGEDAGSTFLVRLPLSTSVPAAAPAPAATGPAALAAEVSPARLSADAEPIATTPERRADRAAEPASLSDAGGDARSDSRSDAGSDAESGGRGGPPPDTKRKPKLVMVVDDNRDAADSLAELLEIKGARVLLAYDAERALELARQRSIDAAVLDIGLPGMDGCQLASALRKLDAGHDLTLIALTGWSQEADRLRILAAGFDHYFVKPVEARKLLALI